MGRAKSDMWFDLEQDPQNFSYIVGRLLVCYEVHWSNFYLAEVIINLDSNL